jgi:hypothetical protein
MGIIRSVSALLCFGLAAIFVIGAGEILWFYLVDLPRRYPKAAPFATLSFGPLHFIGWQIYAVASGLLVIGIGCFYAAYDLLIRRSNG